MAFAIGDVVVSVSNYTYSEAVDALETNLVPLTAVGASGTVVTRSLLQTLPDTAPEVDAVYTYQVSWNPPLEGIGLPTEAEPNGAVITVTHLWVSEANLGITRPGGADLQLIQNTISDAQNKAEAGVATVNSLLSGISTTSKYYDIVKTLGDLTVVQRDTASTLVLTESDPAKVNQNAETAAPTENMLNVDILTEGANNYAQVYAVLAEAEGSMEQEFQQSQQQLAQGDLATYQDQQALDSLMASTRDPYAPSLTGETENTLTAEEWERLSKLPYSLTPETD